MSVLSKTKVGSGSDGYRLTVAKFLGGEAGDDLSEDGVTGANGMRFSTTDKDQDESAGSCVKTHGGRCVIPVRTRCTICAFPSLAIMRYAYARRETFERVIRYNVSKILYTKFIRDHL